MDHEFSMFSLPQIAFVPLFPSVLDITCLVSLKKKCPLSPVGGLSYLPNQREAKLFQVLKFTFFDDRNIQIEYLNKLP